jgi:hypothetical protein
MKIMRIGLMGVFISMALISLFGCKTPTQSLIPPLDTTPSTSVPTITEATNLAPAITELPMVTSTQIDGVTVAPTMTEILHPTENIFFDDFSYADQQTMTDNGWIIRDKAGWPGVPGASWSKESINFINDPDQAGNHLVQMTSTTNGTAGSTQQAQICHQRKYLEGTYSTRIKFSDAPIIGPDGDQVVETFYMISPLEAALDPDYSEMDNEYLPNGGWGNNDSIFFVTTWETAQIEPWIADNTSDNLQGSMADWHTLVVQVMDGNVNYLVDGKLVASHWGKYYPEVAMSINYNLWFINGGYLDSPESRQYNEYVDWVFFAGEMLLTPPEIAARVTELREASILFQDTVPAWDPPLPLPCDL